MKSRQTVSLFSLLVASSWEVSSGFTFTLSSSNAQSPLTLQNSRFDMDEPMSARKARVSLPLSTIASTFAFTLFGDSAPANAGIGSVVPFDVSRKERFSGSIANYVVLLRLQRSLRKRGYFSKMAYVATYKPKDDLAVQLSQDFSDSPLLDLKAGDTSVEEYLQTCINSKKKALILYGQDVDISPDGTVSAIVGDDLKATEQALLEKIGDKALDVTLMGGIIIHRSKTGGKDAGEDCFLPARIMGVRSNYQVDIFEEVFGDLPTSRQTISM